MNSAVHISNMHNVASVMSHTGRCAVHREAGKKCVRKADHIFLDRIDLHIDILPLSFEEMSKTTVSESSAEIRERVVKARQIQEERYRAYPLVHCNAQMTSALMRQFCVLDDKALKVLKNAMQKLDLSARAYDRILKVSRTIADYEGVENITSTHIAEAISYRNLDRTNWVN